MNERIRELAKEACFDEIGKDYSLYFNLTKEKVEKFSKLIIHECSTFLKDTLDDHFAAEQLLEHFGVEE